MIKLNLCKWFGHKWREDNFWRIRWHDGILLCSMQSGHILIIKCARCKKERIFVGDNQIPTSYQIEMAINKIK